MFKRILLYCFLVFKLTLSLAQQIPTGNWRTHLSYRNALICEASSRYVYAASEQGFWRTTDFGEMNLLKTMDGFSGQEVSYLRYNESLDILFIGYADGNIDLLINDQKIINIPGFKNKFLQGDKRILHVSFHQNDALVSTYFGLLVVDVQKHEIRDSYTNIGPNGSEIPVFSGTVMDDSLFIGTATGIRSAPWNRLVNLNDYNQWSQPYYAKNCRQLDRWNDSLYFETDSTVWQYHKGITKPILLNRMFTPRIFSNTQGIHIVRNGGILKINNNGKSTVVLNLVASATQFKNDNYWFCTGFGPGVIKKDPVQEYAFLPNGPDNGSVFSMTQSGNNLLVTGGGVSNTFGNAFNNSGFYLFNEDGWKSNISSPFNSNMYDFTFTCHRKINNHVFAATHSNGILELKGTTIVNRYDNLNSPLKRINDTSFLHIGGLADDSKGNLWVVNHGEDKALHCQTRSGDWYSFELPTNKIKQLIVDEYDRKWMILTSGGILVFHEGKSLTSKTDDESVFINQSHGLLSNDVLSIRADKNGYVWIGTIQGLNVYTGSLNLFTAPKLERFIVDQDGQVGYLMGEETITDILVDGGNRKWFATNSNGVFLVDEYGQKVLRHFNVDNSPILSNRVICIGQIENSGELFIGTDRGIISYRNDAGPADDKFKEIIVYPNPVPPKYDGIITIEGLANNAEIRITDLQGKVISQTKANGGKATWDGYRLDGSKPNSGVYFIFGMNQDGTETAMGKFIYIK